MLDPATVGGTEILFGIDGSGSDVVQRRRRGW